MRLSQEIAVVFFFFLLVLCNWLLLEANDRVSHQSAYSLERLIGLLVYSHFFTFMNNVSLDLMARNLPLTLLHVLLRNHLTVSLGMALPDHGIAAWSVVLIGPLYYSTITLLRPHWRLVVWIFLYTSATKLLAFNCDWRAATADAAVDALTGLVLFGLVHYSQDEKRAAGASRPEIIDLDNFTTDSVAELKEPDALDMRQVLANEVASWQTVVTGYRRTETNQ